MAERNLFLTNKDNMHTNKQEEIKSLEEVAVEEDELIVEDEDFNKKFISIVKKMGECLEDEEVMFSVAKMHYKEKPKDGNVFKDIWNNYMESCTLEKPYNIDQLQDWLAQGSVIIPFTEIEGIRFYTLLVFDIDNDNQELLDKLNNGNPFTMEDVYNHYDSTLQANPVIYYESYSSSADNPRFRLIYILSRPLSYLEYKTVYETLCKDWGAIVHDKNGKEFYKSVIDSSIGSSRHLVFGTNKKVELYDNWGLVDEDAIDKIIQSKLGENYNRFKTYENYTTVGDYLPIKEIVKLDDTKVEEYEIAVNKYSFDDIFKLFDIVSYKDVFNCLFPHKLNGARGQLTYCPFCNTKKPHHGFHEQGNCGIDFRDDCPIKVNDNGYHAIHVNDLIKLYYSIEDDKVAYLILCDMLKVTPVNELTQDYIHEFKPNNKNLRSKKGSVKHTSQSESEDKDIVSGKQNVFDDKAFCTSMEDYLERCPKYNPLVNNLLYFGRMHEMFGTVGSGKSLNGYMIGWSILYLKNAWNCEDFRVIEKTRSLVINFESSYKDIILAFPIKGDDMKLLHEDVCDQYKLDDPGVIESLFDICVKENRKLLIIDPWYEGFRSHDVSDMNEMRPFLEKIKNLARDNGIAVLLINHCNRDGDRVANLGGDLERCHIQGSFIHNQACDYIYALQFIVKSDAEKMQEMELSDEELKKRPVVSKFKRLKGRAANGYDKYLISLDIYNSEVSCNRTLGDTPKTKRGQDKKKLSQEERLEVLMFITKSVLNVGDKFNNTILSGWLFDAQEDYPQYPPISLSKIQKEYAPNIVKRLEEEGLVIKDKKNYIVIEVNKVTNDKKEDVF